jgi:hypothetical protein
MMTVSVADMADRYSICKLKFERIGPEIQAELDKLSFELKNYEDVECYINKLLDVNKKIWDLEADIRAGKEGLLGLEEVGRRAIQIRDLNKIRVSIKNEMVDKYKEGFKDIKINSASC